MVLKMQHSKSFFILPYIKVVLNLQISRYDQNGENENNPSFSE